MNPKTVFDFFNSCVATQENKVFYMLSVLCVLMIIDFILGTAAAWRNPTIKFNSGDGINGIIRKLGSLVLLGMCIPLSVLIPASAGIAALSVLYAGYIVMEFASVLENLRKLGLDVSGLQKFAESFLGANAGRIEKGTEVKPANLNEFITRAPKEGDRNE